MAKFTAMPAIPSSGVPDWEVQTLSAIKANIELLLGQLNKSNLDTQAVLNKSFDLTDPGLSRITSITPISISDIGYMTVSGTNLIITNSGSWNSIPTTLATCGYYDDLQLIKNDIANIRAAVEALVSKLGGG